MVVPLVPLLHKGAGGRAGGGRASGAARQQPEYAAGRCPAGQHARRLAGRRRLPCTPAVRCSFAQPASADLQPLQDGQRLVLGGLIHNHRLEPPAGMCVCKNQEGNKTTLIQAS